MPLAESTACREAALNGRLTYLDSGASNARVRIYGGTRAATPADAPGTALLVEISLQKTRRRYCSRGTKPIAT